MPTNSARTFVALTIPDQQRQRLGRLQGLLAPDLPGARWVSPEMFHLTLCFLGDVPDLDLAKVCRAVNDAASPFPPLALNLMALNTFGDPTRPRTAWIGVGGPDVDALIQLQASIAEAVAAVGYPGDAEKFHPHVTLGRFKGKPGQFDLTRQVAHFKTWAAGLFESTSVHTFASTVTPEGPSYMTLASCPLKPGRHRPADA